jgi:hypothetical protein
VSRLESLLNLLILLDVLHLRLHSLEYNPEFFGLQRNNFIIISDFFDVFNLLSLGLLFDTDNLVFKIGLLRELFDHLSDHLVTISGRGRFKGEGALTDESVNLVDLLFVDDLLQGVFELRNLLVDDLSFK